MTAPSALSVLTRATRVITNAPVSAAIAPTANKQLFCYISSTGSVNAEALPVVSGGGSGQGAWTNVFTITPGVLSKVGIHLFTSTTGATPGAAGTVTVTFAGGASPADATIVVFECPNNFLSIAGLVTTPINSSATSGTQRVTLSATPVGANDRVVLFAGGRNEGTTAPTLGTDASFVSTDHFESTSPVASSFIEEVTGYSGTTADVSMPGTVAHSVTALILKGTSGVTLTQTNTDSAGITDSFSTLITRNVPQTDSVGLADSNTIAFNRGQTNTDDSGISDSFSVLLQHNQTNTDDSGLTDNNQISMGRGVPQSDLVGLSDNFTLAFIRRLTVDDSVGLTDSSTATVFPPPSATQTDNVGLTDSFSILLVGGNLVAGTIMDQIMADLITRGFLVGTVLDRERARLVAALALPNGGAGLTIDDLYAKNHERNRVALESVAIIPGP